MSETKGVQDFITAYISSVAELEALLLLYRSPGEAWTADQLSREMRSNPSYAEALLERLCVSGVVERNSDQYQLKIQTEEQKKIMEDLVSSYQTKRLSIIDLIYQKPVDKLRVFADAFKIRK